MIYLIEWQLRTLIALFVFYASACTQEPRP